MIEYIQFSEGKRIEGKRETIFLTISFSKVRILPDQHIHLSTDCTDQNCIGQQSLSLKGAHYLRNLLNNC